MPTPPPSRFPWPPNAWRDRITVRFSETGVDIQPARLTLPEPPMTRDHAERTIRALLDVSFNATDYPLTLEPEPGKTGDWQFRVFYGDKWSLVKPSGHITWNGTEWRPAKPAST